MNNIEDNYLVSKDYDLLWKLVKEENKSLVVFIDYKSNGDPRYWRDVAKIQHKEEKYIFISARGIGYSGWGYCNQPDLKQFKEFCKENNLSFIAPKTEDLAERYLEKCKVLDELIESKMRYPEKYEN